MQGLEKYLMTRIHHKTFAASALDRERDEALALRMAALDFVTARHLDIPPGLLDSDAPVQAMKELHKVNDYKVRLHLELVLVPTFVLILGILISSTDIWYETP